MRAVVYSPFSSYERKCLAAAATAGMDLYAAPSLQEFGSQLYRDPDAIGVLWSMGATSAAMTLRQYRLAEVDNRIIVLLQGEQSAPSFVQSTERTNVLTAGADDVQPSEIDQRELTARLQALATRGAYFDHLKIQMCDGVFVRDRLTIESPRGDVRLTGKESAILQALARFSGTMTKEAIMDAVYGDEDDQPLIKIIDVLICKLRRKIVQATGGKDVIQTIYGQGYSFDAEGYLPELVATRACRARMAAR